MYLDLLRREAETHGMVDAQRSLGVTDLEIQKAELQLSIQLPGAYKEFLHWVGQGDGQLLPGCDWQFKAIFALQRWTTELLEENDILCTFPTDGFTFFNQQGAFIYFFRTCDGDNPPVYMFSEGYTPKDFRLAFASFSACAHFLICRQYHLRIGDNKALDAMRSTLLLNWP